MTALLEWRIATAILATLLIAVAVIDARTRRIPDLLNLAILACGFAAAWRLNLSITAALIGAVLGYALIFAANALFRKWRARDGIGMGDAKLLGALGAWVGWMGLPFVGLAASAAGLAYALLRGRSSTDTMPFGPFLAAGGFSVWVAQAFQV